MSTKRASVAAAVRSTLGLFWYPRTEDPEAASAALAVTVALLRGLRNRGVPSTGEIDDLFDEARGGFQKGTAVDLINQRRVDVHRKDAE
jgi:hypothetical protein